MNKCIDCGKQFDPQAKGASPVRGPKCNHKHLNSWSIPEEVDKVVEKLSKDHPVYLVGGSVRDYILGRPIKDYDLVTSAKTEELEKLFPNSLEVGKQFGIVKVPVKGDIVEIATFREDGEYLDGRRPDSVKEGTMESDVQRRDFTINGLLFDIKTKEIIDQVGGLNDLNNRQIKAIGVAKDRFLEDHLRVLRAIRFATVLNFKIEDNTLSAACEVSPLLSKISRERIKVELDKTFDHENLSNQVGIFEKTKVLSSVFPHLNDSEIDLVHSNMKIVKSPTKELVYSWIFKDNEKLMNEYKLTNQEIKQVSNTYKVQEGLKSFSNLPLAQKNKLILDKDFSVSMDFLSQTSMDTSDISTTQAELKSNPLPLNLLTSGKELIEFGFSPGSAMGKLIQEVNLKIYGREITSESQKNEFILKNKV